MRRTCLAVAVAVSAVACSGSGGGTTPSSTPSAVSTSPGSAVSSAPVDPGTVVSTGALTASEATALLEGFSFEGDGYLALLDAADDPAVVSAAESALTEGVEGLARWAATLVCVNGCPDAAPLVPLAADADPTIRVMAATGLLARGHALGLETAVDLLDDDDVSVGREPPAPVWVLAAEALARFTGRDDLGPPFDATTAQRSLAQHRWTTWWADQAGQVPPLATDQQAMAALDRLSAPSRPTPLPGDQETVAGWFVHEADCDRVLERYLGPDGPIPTGSRAEPGVPGVVIVEGPFGASAVVAAETAPDRCTYAVVARPTVSVTGADPTPIEQFATVTCSSTLGLSTIAADLDIEGAPHFLFATVTDGPAGSWVVAVGPGSVSDYLGGAVPESALQVFPVTADAGGTFPAYHFDGSGLRADLVCTPSPPA